MEKCRICKIQRQSELNTSLYFSTPNFMRRTSIIRRLTVTEHKMTKSNIQTRRKNQTILFFLRLEKSLQQDLLSTRNSLKERKLPKSWGTSWRKRRMGEEHSRWWMKIAFSLCKIRFRTHLVQIPQDGENGQYVAFFLNFWSSTVTKWVDFFNFSHLFLTDCVRYILKMFSFWS